MKQLTIIEGANGGRITAVSHRKRTIENEVEKKRGIASVFAYGNARKHLADIITGTACLYRARAAAALPFPRASATDYG